MNISCSQFSNNKKGVHILSENANVAIVGSQFRNNNIGVEIVDRGKFAIGGCQFTHHQVAAIRVSRNISRSQSETVSISDNVFAHNVGVIDLKLSRYTSLRLVRNKFEDEFEPIIASIKITVWHSNVTVEGNEFLRMRSEALFIVANVTTNIIIRNNTWKYGKKTLSIHNDGRYGPGTTRHTTTIERNVFHANSEGMYLSFKGNTTTRIWANEFTENTGRATIYLMESTIPLKIYANKFYMNAVNEGVIHALRPITIFLNSFNNPNSSHDLVLGGRGVSNATNNWWGIGTPSAVARRIGIVDNDPKIVVNWDPFLTRDTLMACAKVANCSNHGICVWENACRCDVGWLPPNCSQATCSRVDNCNGHGRCVAPNRYDDTEV